RIRQGTQISAVSRDGSPTRRQPRVLEADPGMGPTLRHALCPSTPTPVAVRPERHDAATRVTLTKPDAEQRRESRLVHRAFSEHGTTRGMKEQIRDRSLPVTPRSVR